MNYELNIAIKGEESAEQKIDKLVTKLNAGQKAAEKVRTEAAKARTAAPSAAGSGKGSLLREGASELLSHIPGGQLLSRLGLGASAGIVGLAGAAAGMKHVIDSANALSDLSDRLEISTNELQRLSYAAKATDSDLGTFAGIIEHIKRAQSEALQGHGDWVKDFERLGVSMADLKRKSGPELFYQLGNAIQNGAINASNFSSAFQILGQNAKEALPALKKGVEDAAKEFDSMGLTIDSGTVRRLSQLSDTGKSTFATLGAAAKKFGADLTDSITSGFKKLGSYGLIAAGRITGSQTTEQMGEDMQVNQTLGEDADNNRALDLQASNERKLNEKKAAKLETAKRVKEFQDQNAQSAAKLAYDEMSHEEKINFLLAARANLLKNINAEKDPEKQQAMLSLLLNNRGQLDALKPSGPGMKAQVSSLARIGGYADRADVQESQRVEGKNQSQYLKSMDQRLKSIEGRIVGFNL